MGRPRTNIPERIIRAARHEFLEHGVAATPLRAIARRARTNLGMIYYYFPSKEDLFLAVIEEPYAKIVDSIGAILGTSEPVRDRIRALYRRIGAATPDEVDTFRLVISEGLKSPALRARLFARVWRGHLPIVFKAIEDGKRDGAFDASLPTPLLGLVTAAIGVLPQVVARAMPLGLVGNEALADRLTDVLLDGIGRRGR
ncbi:MAG TPA: TetR/AcrR family transcriptional regulator [Kofleriaceae bacterium]|nr:TetR/AcrR family transcriptional regulator [Kofleriaceae bacterium]